MRPLLGSSVFLADQTGCRFRFLAEHGIPPRLVWLSRQIRGLLVMLLGLLLVLPPMIGLIVNDIKQLRRSLGMLVTECLLGFAVAAYACGQLCSMGIRSGILAAAFGTILTAVLCGWAAIMYLLGLSWLWSVAPLLLAFLVVTWLARPELARGAKELAGAASAWPWWLRFPLLAILVAIPLVRVYEIPLVGPGFDVAELTRPLTPEAKETLALYQRAVQFQHDAAATRARAAAQPTISPPAASESAGRKANELEEQAVTLALEASRRPIPAPYSDPDIRPYPDEEIHLAELVLAGAERVQSEGKLDAALDRYVAAMRIANAESAELEVRACEDLARWAAKKGQTPQRVLEALRNPGEAMAHAVFIQRCH